MVLTSETNSAIISFYYSNYIIVTTFFCPFCNSGYDYVKKHVEQGIQPEYPAEKCPVSLT